MAAVGGPSNRTGLPDSLQAGLESLSGFDLGDVNVHHGSSQPAQLNALAYAQGTENHFAPGGGAGSDPMAHELTHVVQQARGRLFAGQY